MSKLCQCLEERIYEAIWDSIPELGTPMSSHDVSFATKNIVSLLESDCVCEKKEERSHDRSKTVGLHIGNGHIELNSNYFAPTKEKQSQSPCEPMTDRAELSHCEHERMSYLYLPANLASPGLFLCKKCGLVTCLNPNDK